MVFKEDSAEVHVTIMTNEERDTVSEEMVRIVDRKFKGAEIVLKFTNMQLYRKQWQNKTICSVDFSSEKILEIRSELGFKNGNFRNTTCT